jgi:membrane protease YdiL (CAAX protease family)
MTRDSSQLQKQSGAPDERQDAPGSEDNFARELRGFGVVGILAILVIIASAVVGPLLTAVMVLIWAKWSRTPWREIGYARPRNWFVSTFAGVAFGIALKFLLKAIVMPLLGAEAINQAYHYLAGNRAALPSAMFAMVVGAGFGEETVFRGYLFERLGKLFGPGAGAKAFIVLFTTTLFALAHYSNQGLAGVEQAAITGLLFGTIFAVTGRLWMLMWAHAAFDLTALAIIYFDLEWAVAHWVFK